MRLAILETGAPPARLADRFDAYPRMFARLLDIEPAASFAVTEGRWPERPEAFDAYLVTGSPAGVYDPLPWIAELMDFLRAARGKAALVGVCFGHQVMAEAFGGHVIKSPKGWGVGLHDYQVVERQPWMDQAAHFAIPASHQDQVVIKPPEASVAASSAFTAFAALAYPGGPGAISFQGHPEFEAAYAQALVENRRGGHLTEAAADAAITSLKRPSDGARVGGWIRTFLASKA